MIHNFSNKPRFSNLITKFLECLFKTLTLWNYQLSHWMLFRRLAQFVVYLYILLIIFHCEMKLVSKRLWTLCLLWIVVYYNWLNRWPICNIYKYIFCEWENNSKQIMFMSTVLKHFSRAPLNTFFLTECYFSRLNWQKNIQ